MKEKDNNTINDNDFKLPIVIGITGHRDIPKNSIEPLKLKIVDIFTNLLDKYPNTPFILLTPLADGADRIIADAVLENDFNNRITISVPLPMDEEIYINTFGKGKTLYNEDESIKKYRLLINKINKERHSSVPIKIPMLFDKEKYNSMLEEEQRLERRKQYSIVGEYIAIHCHILIAIYNENSPLEEGGTKEIFKKKLSGEYKYMSVLDGDVTYPEQGIVYSISTPRIDSNIDDPKNKYEIKKYFPDAKTEIGLKNLVKKEKSFTKLMNYLSGNSCLIHSSLNRYAQQHKKIDCFNKDVSNNLSHIRKKAEKDLEEYTSSNKLIKKNILLRRSAAYLADSYFKPLVSAKEKGILFLIVFIVFILAIKSNISHFSLNLYVDSFYFLLLIPVIILILELNNVKEKQEDYRALAEGLRVQVAWNMAEINESVSMYYLSHQRNELDWIRSAIRCTNIFYIPSSSTNVKEMSSLEKYWLNAQIKYFSKNIPKKQNKENSSSKLLQISFSVYLISTLLYLIVNFYTDYLEGLNRYFWNLSILDITQIFLIVMPLTLSAYIKSKQLFDGNEEIIREYTLSLDLFCRAKKMLQKQEENQRSIIRNLGIEALRENSSWIITRRTKKYDAPT